MHGPESKAIKDAVNAIHQCATRFALEQESNKLVEIFRFSTPQGQEVWEWLSDSMLSRFAHVFARNQLDSLRKVSHLTAKEINKLNDEFCANIAGNAETQVGGRAALGK